MKSIFRPSTIILFLISFLVACAGEQSDPSATLANTNIPVGQDFQAFHNRFGGHNIFGDPITEAFRVQDGDPTLQYFQAMRLELREDPDLVESEQVIVYPLGQWALEGLNEQIPWPGSEDGPSRYFAETDLSVQGDFLVFYEANNGEQLLGPPISIELDEDGRRVQYSRNGRLDWYPELPPDQRVQLAPLGQAHYDAVMAFIYPEYLSKEFVPGATVTTVNIYAHVQHPVLYQGDQQLLYITILTPEGRSVSGLSIQVAISHGNTTETLVLALAEGQNMTQTTIDSVGVDPGEPVNLLITVLSAGGTVVGTDTLNFKTWW